MTVSRGPLERLFVALVVLTITVAGDAYAQNAKNTITVDLAFVQASSPGLRNRLEESLAAAVAAADQSSRRARYRMAGSTRSSDGGSSGGEVSASLSVTAVEGPDERYIALSLAEGPATGTSLLVRAPWDEVLPQVLSQAVRFFEPAVFGYPEAGDSALKYVDEIPLEGLRPPSPSHSMLGLYPMGIAILPTGSVVVAGSTFAVELDSLFRVQSYPGIELLDSGTYSYARAAGATPAGTLYLQPTQGNDFYRIIPGTARPQRVRGGVGGFGPLVVLPDGSLVTIDSVGKRAMRIHGRERVELPLFSHPDAYLTAAAAGPAGNIWVFDAVEQRILIHDPDGRHVDSIIPAIPAGSGGQTVGIAPYQDGSFILLTRGGLWKIRRDGQPEWVLPELPDGSRSSFAQAIGVAVDSRQGFVYVTDSQRRTVTRLRDTALFPSDVSTSRDGNAALHRRLAALNSRLARGGEDPRLLAEKARLYEEAEAGYLAEETWKYVLDLDPFNQEAQDGLEELEFRRLESQAARAAHRARETLATLGPASARESYLEALRLYEELIAMRPARDSARQDMESLRRHFEEAQGGEPGGGSPLILDDIAMENVFPSLFSTYRTRPVGEITVTNGGDVALRSIQAEVEIRRYGDFPTTTELATPLRPGESERIPLRLVLNTNVFEVEEDLPLQARIRARAVAGDREVVVERSASFTLHRRTALTWIEAERLAPFITPNESNITRFALAAASDPESDAGTYSRAFPRAFYRAARIVDTLGLYGISYVEDPRTPISAVLGRRDVVDTVRLPRTTLLNRAGDCDDTSALVASLLEAAGISTAVITTPDHVLIAFDTGEPGSNAWIYESAGFAVFVAEGRLWLPVETTVLRDGFAGAVTAAAHRIRNAGGPSSVGFVTTDEASARYPTIPVPPTQLNLTLPTLEAVSARNRDSRAAVIDAIYRPAMAHINSALAATRGRYSAPLLSRLGSLHSRFGQLEEAEKSFSRAVAADPASPVPRIHYASHLLSTGRPEEAIDVLQPAVDAFPDALLVNALIARSYIEAGRAPEARPYLRLVNDRSPTLARRYAIVLAPREAIGGARASLEFDHATASLPESTDDVTGGSGLWE